ncbi:MAG: phosphotransferase [Bacteroidetes bacterium]|nr:phosphotransferase [Bacteroidota bacterium]MCW5896764.1 phosphotransferase [Bacteroidota bacterium]
MTAPEKNLTSLNNKIALRKLRGFQNLSSSIQAPDFQHNPIDFVPIVRRVLQLGFSEQFMRSCVRIGKIEQLGEGFKADFVGTVRTDVHTVVKLGTDELKLHKALIELVNSQYPRTFPDVLHIDVLDDVRFVLLMEQMRKFKSFSKYLYNEATEVAVLNRLVDKAISAIKNVHKTTVRIKSRIGTSVDPYTKRIDSKLRAILKADEALSSIMSEPGYVNGKKVPPLNNTLKTVKARLQADLPKLRMNLVHGDPHLGNILFRKRGHGFSCFLIDPNPLIGMSDPIYDFGKLLHWMQPVGWVARNPKSCHSRWIPPSRKSRWVLDIHLSDIPKAAELRRKRVEQYTLDKIEEQREGDWDNWEYRLRVSVASAHLGLAEIMSTRGHTQAGRFVLAHAILELGKSVSAEL